MVNFSNAVEELNNYRGSEKKKTLIYDNKKYLVKFPDPIREKDKQISLFDNKQNEKQEKLDETLDKIKEKYGHNFIKRGGEM